MVAPPFGHYIMYCNIVQLVLKSCVGQYTMFNGESGERYGAQFPLLLNSLRTLDPLYSVNLLLCTGINTHIQLGHGNQTPGGMHRVVRQ